MQSGGKVKRVQEYEIGDRVYDGDCLVGRVVAVDEHPVRKSIGYVLVVDEEGGFSIMRGATDVRQWLCVARSLPEQVATYFAEVILGKEVEPRELPSKKFPVVEDEERVCKEESSRLAPMPYLDVV